jgi:molecular chaperone GrpE (heat shock protein)
LQVGNNVKEIKNKVTKVFENTEAIELKKQLVIQNDISFGLLAEVETLEEKVKSYRGKYAYSCKEVNSARKIIEKQRNKITHLIDDYEEKIIKSKDELEHAFTLNKTLVNDNKDLELKNFDLSCNVQAISGGITKLYDSIRQLKNKPAHKESFAKVTELPDDIINIH